MKTVDRIKELLGPMAEKLDCLVLEVEFKRRGSERFLKIILDKPGGITLDECASVNTELGDILEKENVIDEHYCLEVTSPGLDRTLKADNDFVWAVGKKVKATTYKAFDGKNVFKGKLVGLGEGSIVIEDNGVSAEIPRNMIAKAKLDPDIDWDKGE